MYHYQGVSSLPRNFKHAISRDEGHEPRSPSAYDKREIRDLKFSLDQALIERERSFDDHKRRRSRYDPRRKTTGVTEYELQQNQTSKQLYL